MEFIVFDDMIISFFYKSDIDFFIILSNYNIEGFKYVLDVFKVMSKFYKFVFDFKI